MVSNPKRSRYVSESTTDDDMGDIDYSPNNQSKKTDRKPTRTPKCFSKNALMARENRIKKKVYMANLENQVSSLKSDNKKLTSIVENQSFMLDELKKEIKYLKSVIANSDGIGKLIQAINSSTGMLISSSLDKTLSVNRDHVVKSPAPSVPEMDQWHQNFQGISNISTKHPWEEKDNSYKNYPTPNSTNSYYSSPEFDELNNDGLLLDLDLPFEMNNDELLNIINEKSLEAPTSSVDDHNYHNPIKYEQQDTGNNSDNDVGVCLHVSNNKVSLEFCPSCSDNALQSRRAT